MEPSEQQEFAKIYVSAFLEYSLRGNGEYLPIFRDHRVAGGWLPKTMYVTRFEDGSFRPLATFEEDIDVTTGSAAGVVLGGDSLSTWREKELVLRSRNRPTTSSSQMNQALWLGWNREVRGSEELGRPATFTISLPDTLGRAWRLGEGASLQMALAAVTDVPGPRDAEEEDESSDAFDDDEEDDLADEKEPINLSIEIVDSQGRSAKVALGAYGPIRRPLETHILRRGDLEEERFTELAELVLQSYSIPLSDFTLIRPALDLRSLREIRLVFDLSEAGTVVVDDVGISYLDPAFTAVRVVPQP